MKKWIIWLIGVAVVTAGMIVTSIALNMNSHDDVAKNVKRKSTLYRGIEVVPNDSKSYINEATSTYVFESVLQGDIVKHDFYMTNDSGQPLTIKNVKGCCGILVESYSRHIEPGREGRLSILMLTDKYGGQGIEGLVTAETNDEKRPLITIHISLPVAEFAKIDPHKIILKGSYHNALKGTSVVIPAADYPFHITGIIPKKGIDISHSFHETVIDGIRQYVITVVNIRKTPGIYRDILFVQTDHKARPEFKIRVDGQISE